MDKRNNIRKLKKHATQMHKEYWVGKILHNLNSKNILTQMDKIILHKWTGENILHKWITKIYYTMDRTNMLPNLF